MRRILALVVLVAVLAGCSGDTTNPDFTAPREGQPAAPYNEVGPDPPQQPSPATNELPPDALGAGAS